MPKVRAEKKTRIHNNIKHGQQQGIFWYFTIHINIKEKNNLINVLNRTQFIPFI